MTQSRSRSLKGCNSFGWRFDDPFRVVLPAAPLPGGGLEDSPNPRLRPWQPFGLTPFACGADALCVYREPVRFALSLR